MAETTDLARVQYQDKIIAVDNSSFSSYLDTAKFEQIQRVAKMFAASDMVPEHYRNKPANCALGVQMAMRLEMDPMMFLQHSYVVHGKPGLEAVIMIGLVNSRGPFTGPIQWKFDGQGKTRQCTAYATHKTTKEVCSTTVTWAMVDAEGWNKKAGSKWLTMPDLMFQYRSASFLAKLYCPETILGLPTKEELEDIESGDKYEPAPPKTGRIEERMRKQVENTAPTAEETAKQLAEAEANAAEKLPDIEHPKKKAKPAPTDAKIQAELDAAALADAEIEEFAKPVPPKAENTKQDARTDLKPCRYLCNACSNESDTLAGPKKDLCRKCLSNDIVDREKK